jgi:cysteine desulfurase
MTAAVRSVRRVSGENIETELRALRNGGVTASLIYLDSNATTPADPAVIDFMAECQKKYFGNPSSAHIFGQEAKRVIETARAQAAKLIGAAPSEIIFTSGGTEASNTALFGAAEALAKKSGKIRVLAGQTEHQSVLGPCRALAERGATVEFLRVDREGVLDLDYLGDKLRDGASLVTVMMANNDTGTLQPVREIAAMAKAAGALFHCDAVQAAGKIPVDVTSVGADLLSFSSHKIYGPKGAGALFVKAGTRLAPLLYGGHQERSLRPGTENCPGIAGFGKACGLALERMEEDALRIGEIRDAFEEAVLRMTKGSIVNGGGGPRLHNSSNISFPGLDGEALVINLDILGLAASTGAACAASLRESSHVLAAMGRGPAEARESVRFSFGRSNSFEELPSAAARVIAAVEALRHAR